MLQSPWGAVVATWHPSAVLRVGDDPQRARALFGELTKDLRLAARQAKLPGA
jgi:hypothetical protein